QADGVLDYSTNYLVLSVQAQRVSFNYSSGSKEVSMTDTNGTTKILLKGCDFLKFEVFQRNPVGGSYDQYAVNGDDSVAKMVQVSWICSRHLLGALLNTESVQSAKIVIRKQ